MMQEKEINYSERVNKDMIIDIREKVKETEPLVREWFHYLHENPELGFEEFQTAAFVEETLKSFQKIEVRRLGKTGVMGILKTGRPGKTIAFRADMDALPIQEDSTHRVCSKKAGVMHACGHDGHTATLLGAAKCLSQMQEKLQGEFRFIFQPSEEIQPGGAKRMVEEGAADGVDYIFGMHYNADEMPGTFLIHSGTDFAASCNFRICLSGKGGHAAFPHYSQDTVLASAQIVSALHQIVPRFLDPQSGAVLSVTQIHGGNSYNSFPETVEMGGTIRYQDEESGRVLIEKAQQIAQGIGNVYGFLCRWELKEGCGLVYNEPVLTEAVKNLLECQFGKWNVINHNPVMGSEDFSEYLRKVRGVYFWAGCKTVEEDGSSYPSHTSGYQLNEEALGYGLESVIRVMTAFSQN